MEQGKVDYPLATFTVNLSMEICLHSIYVRNIQNGKNGVLVVQWLANYKSKKKIQFHYITIIPRNNKPSLKIGITIFVLNS